MKKQIVSEMNKDYALTNILTDNEDSVWYHGFIKNFLEKKETEGYQIQELENSSKNISQIIRDSKYFLTTGLLPDDYVRPEGQTIIKIWVEETVPDMEDRVRGDCHRLYQEQHTLLQATYILFPNDEVRDVVTKAYCLDQFYTGKILVAQGEILDYSINQSHSFQVIWPGTIQNIRQIDTLYHVSAGEDILVLIESEDFMAVNLKYLLENYCGSFAYLFILDTQTENLLEHQENLGEMQSSLPLGDLKICSELRLDYYSGKVGDIYRLKDTEDFSVSASVCTENNLLKIQIREAVAGMQKLLVVANSSILWERALTEQEIAEECIREDFSSIVRCNDVIKNETYSLAVESLDQEGNPMMHFLKEEDYVSRPGNENINYYPPLILSKSSTEENAGNGIAILLCSSSQEPYLGFIPVLQFDMANRYMKGELLSYKFHKSKLSVKIRLEDTETPILNVLFIYRSPVEDVRYPMEYTLEEKNGYRIVRAAFDVSKLQTDDRETGEWEIQILSDMFGIQSVSYIYFCKSFFRKLQSFFKLNNFGSYYGAENGNLFFPVRTETNTLVFTFCYKSKFKYLEKKWWGVLRRLIRRVIYSSYHMLCNHVSIDDKMVIFISFHGRGYSDNPKAIYEAMRKDSRFADYRFIWFIKHHRQKKITIEGAEVKEYYSIPYFYYMSKAKYWVVNCKLPRYLWKKKEQIYLQTWHGTPLKRLAHDIIAPEGTTFYRSGMSYEDMLNTYDVDVARYNYMISPNKFCTEVFQSAFQIDRARLIETGYPRNDFITNATPADVEKIKKKYGIPLDKKVVLYAPTWRDNSYVAAGYTFELEADFHKWKEMLGPDYVVLFKPHYLIINKYENDASLEGFLFSIPAEAEINELYVISDILITDYSSVFFDYAVLDRPIYFYMYDLDSYKDELRGFYLDIYTELPGKIYENENDMLPDIKSGNYDYDRLAKFNERFNYAQTGDCAEKVINIVFGD